jgi:hypothetical protein
MRRHQRKARDGVRGGVNERDRSAVGMPDKQRLLDAEVLEQGGKHLTGFLVHETRGARRR